MLTMDQLKSTGRPNEEEATGAPAPPAAQPFAEESSFDSGTRLPIYGSFFGLDSPPFDLTADSKFLFLTPQLREAMSNLRYGLANSKGLTVVLGEAGTGKTTLVRAALAGLGDADSRYVLLSNPTLGRSEFYEFLATQFGFTSRAKESKTQFLIELEEDVRRRFARGGLTGLIVDEAQSMPYALLEEIRLLGNIETPTSKLLNIVLSGQPELAQRLNEPSLRQLKQRIALRCELRPLTIDEAAAYISGRLRIAGGAPEKVFTAQAVMAIHKASSGIPRSINVLCDNALVSGFALQVKPVNAAVIADVCRDFDLGTSTRAENSSSTVPAIDDKKKTSSDPQAGSAVAETGPDMFKSVHTKKRSLFSFFS
jgi:general secretion pathway protein A